MGKGRVKGPTTMNCSLLKRQLKRSVHAAWGQDRSPTDKTLLGSFCFRGKKGKERAEDMGAVGGQER